MKQKKKKKTENYYCLCTLLDRGWSKTLIKKFLPKHDAEKTNPHYKCAAPMKLYKVKRVEKIEQTDKFKEELNKVEKRRSSAMKAVETKEQKALEYAKTVEITIPSMPYDRLVKNACKHYNNFHSYYYHDSYASPDCGDDSFLHRISVNYLRHQCSDYDYYLSDLYGQVGVQSAHDILKERVNNEIYSQYPMLKYEQDKKSDRLRPFKA